MKVALLAVCIAAGVVGTLLGCGGSNQTTSHDGTTVTLQKPADSSAPPASSK
jgi:hypothetical protein